MLDKVKQSPSVVTLTTSTVVLNKEMKRRYKVGSPLNLLIPILVCSPSPQSPKPREMLNIAGEI